MSGQARAILKDVAALWGGVAVTQTLGFFLAIFTRRHIGPGEMGVWTLFQTFLGYASYAGFVYDGVFREIPIARGRGEIERARHLGNVAFTFILGGAFLISLAAAAYGLLYRGTISPALSWGLAAFVFLNILMRWSNFLVGYLYAEKKFAQAGRFRSISALVNAVLILAAVGRWGIRGFYAAMLLSFMFNIYYAGRLLGLKFRLVWDAPELKGLMRVSAGLAFAGVGHTLLSSMDRLAVGRFLGLEALGLYSLAMMGSGYILMFSYMSTAVLYPRLLERHGESASPLDTLTHSRKAAMLLSALLPAGVGIAWIFSPALVAWLLPKYTGGVEALKALVVAAALMTLINQQGQLLIAFGRQIRMTLVYGAAVAVAALAYGMLSSADVPLEAYAWVTAGAFLCVYIGQTYLTCRGICDARSQRGYVFEDLFPLASVCAILALADILLPGADARSTGMRALIFTAPLAWLVWTAQRRTGLIGILMEIVKSKKATSRELKEVMAP